LKFTDSLGRVSFSSALDPIVLLAYGVGRVWSNRELRRFGTG
jgi:hypothetical protein